MFIVNCTATNIECLSNKNSTVIQSGEKVQLDLQLGDTFEIRHLYKSSFDYRVKFFQLLDYFPLFDWLNTLCSRPYMNIVIDSSYFVDFQLVDKTVYVRDNNVQVDAEAVYDYFLLVHSEVVPPLFFYCQDAADMKKREKRTSRLIDNVYVVLAVVVIFTVCNLFYDTTSELLLFQIIPLFLSFLFYGLWRFISFVTKKGTKSKELRIESFFEEEKIYRFIMDRFTI